MSGEEGCGRRLWSSQQVVCYRAGDEAGGLGLKECRERERSVCFLSASLPYLPASLAGGLLVFKTCVKCHSFSIILFAHIPHLSLPINKIFFFKK